MIWRAIQKPLSGSMFSPTQGWPREAGGASAGSWRVPFAAEDLGFGRVAVEEPEAPDALAIPV